MVTWEVDLERADVATVVIQCPKCLAKYSVAQELLGRPITCQVERCRQAFKATPIAGQTVPGPPVQQHQQPQKPLATSSSIEFKGVVDSENVAVSEERLNEILNGGKRKRPELSPKTPAQTDTVVDAPTQPMPPPRPTKSTRETTANAFQLTTRHAQIIFGALAAGLLMQFISTVGQFIKPVTKWEYKIESPSDYSFTSEMDRLGSEGWEMISARRASSEFGTTVGYEVIFKRPSR